MASYSDNDKMCSDMFAAIMPRPLVLQRTARQNPYYPCSKQIITFPDVNRVQELIRQGADVNCRRGSAVTPLMIAAFTGPVDLVVSLLSNGADPNAVNNDGKSALDYANSEENPYLGKPFLNLGLDFGYLGQCSGYDERFPVFRYYLNSLQELEHELEEQREEQFQEHALQADALYNSQVIYRMKETRENIRDEIRQILEREMERELNWQGRAPFMLALSGSKLRPNPDPLLINEGTEHQQNVKRVFAADNLARLVGSYLPPATSAAARSRRGGKKHSRKNKKKKSKTNKKRKTK